MLNIGSADDNANANAVTLDLGDSAAIILVSGTNPGKVAIPKKTSVITLGAGTGGSAAGNVPTAIGGKTITSSTFQAADYTVLSGKLLKIGGTNDGGSITASITANTDVVIDSTQAVTVSG